MKIEHRQRDKNYTANQKILLAAVHLYDQTTGAANPEVKEYVYGEYIG